MPKQSTSPWDFTGELFPVAATRRVFSVAELTGDVRRLLEQHIGQVWVSGEVSNLRQQSSGHVYFTLKDAAAQLSCVAFRSDPVANREALKDGQRVILKGQISVYEARGQYQLQVLAVEVQGLGALQAAFERLKQKLNAEGLFAPESKRPVPDYPARIGLVTSPTGAAIRDVLHVIQRRNPMLEIIFAPCAVQGPGAASEIAAALARLSEFSERSPKKIDVILLTRGGGSLEDLWAFNEEVVARAIFKCVIPIVSAVGHEIDFTISDFVADLRAATPSAGAEILTENVFASSRWIAQLPEHLCEIIRRRLNSETRHFQQITYRLRALHPRRKFNEVRQRLDDLQEVAAQRARQQLQNSRAALRGFRERLHRARPSQTLVQRRQLLEERRRRLREETRHRVETARRKLEALSAHLRLLGPEQVLARGYSITLDAATGAIIRNAAQARPAQTIRTRLAKGEITSVVRDPDATK
jgi:exodeoxyribonuclease VII large subunit